MPIQSKEVRHVRTASERLVSANSVVSRRKEVQAKGVFFQILEGACTDSGSYIKELAERVSRLEYPGAAPTDAQHSPLGHSQPNADPRTYTPHMDFNTPNQRKRTHSMAADSPQHYVQAQEQYAGRAQAHIAQAGPTDSGNYVAQAPVYDLPAHTGQTVAGLPSAVLNGYERVVAGLPG